MHGSSRAGASARDPLPVDVPLQGVALQRASGRTTIAGVRSLAILVLLWLALSGDALASSDPLSGVAPPGGVGIGAAFRQERSPYKGGGWRRDFVPLYLYEGDTLFLHTYSVGMRFGKIANEPRYEIFLRHRFEGFPYDKIPASLAGMAKREAGIDAGASVQVGGSWGIAFAEALHDVSSASRGNELRLGYKYPWRHGRLWLRPYVQLGVRDARLNDYYYGVRPDEATPDRPAYRADGGVTPEIGFYAAYNLTERMRLIGGYSASRWSSGIGNSPVVGNRTVHQVALGLMYDLTPEQEAWPEHRPLIFRIYNGDSTDCNVLQVAELRCTSRHTRDRTGVYGVEIGRPFIERLNGWPVDLAGFVGLQRHREEGFQPDFWSIRAYVKSYFYGFPWDDRIRTRIGLGVGLSYAQRIPLMEVRDLQERGRNTSKLLQTFDPTVDFSVGDLLKVKSLRETYLGFGVSHRSGIFATSQVLGNVNGGSNYIYSYLETSF